METALVTALIAAGAAVAAAVVSWFGAFQNRRTADRDHAWKRFTWSVAQHADSAAYDISTAVLRELESVPWWSKQDQRLATSALRRRVHLRRPNPQGEED
ncbi:hypothetical protein SAMN02800687_2951 [Curtobacterium sp. UNCCL20]|uniref:hypothetical protein n=1 Tax=Curtobacterium sp. UNCCL20 TaxID=1502773 RepID=UPI00087E3E06|nr:hypothetical protein [Curtobacterium sp. UNCCL20]SDQ88257.1 hypothetical protein SAMN02800687_2951 [Curtobacterium sp. UNCCL20]